MWARRSAWAHFHRDSAGANRPQPPRPDLTDLAGLEAQVIVWIASDCRDPHRSAIHWLNDHTVAPLVFFALRVQAVRIGESPRHPMGNSSLVVVTDISDCEDYGLPRSLDNDA